MPASYSLGKRYETMVRDLVQSGRYASASEVVRDGLRLIEEREEQRQAKLTALRAAIKEGMDSGLLSPLDMTEVVNEAKAMKRAAQG